MNIKIEETKEIKELARLNETVQKLHHELYPEEFKPFNLFEIEKALGRMMSNPLASAFVAKVDEIAIGYIIFIVKNRPENEFQYEKTLLYIDQISVDESHREIGIAERLLERVLDFAKEKKITEIQLDHWDENSVAKQFFSKMGFKYFNHSMRRK